MDFGAGNQNRTDDPIIAKQFRTVSEANVGRPYQWRALPTEPWRNKDKKSIAIAMDFGAGNQNRTDDLVITNDVLYRLSHTSKYSLCLDDLSIISNKFRFVKPFFQIF